MDALDRLRELTEKLYLQGQLRTADVEPFFFESPLLLLIADANGICVKANRAWEVELGRAPHSMEGKPYLELVHPHDRDATQAAAGDLHKHGVADFRNRYRSKTGEYRWLSWRASRYDDGNLTYAAAEVLEGDDILGELEDLGDQRARSVEER